MRSRRLFLRALAGGVLAAVGLGAWRRQPTPRTSWQIDPRKCTQCGQCATACVLTPSAVKCVHAYAMCGYCKLCFGYFHSGAPELTEAAENQLCPAGALQRTFVEDPYFEYTVDESKCLGCAVCVKGCTQYGNGSLYLQIRHDRCVNCNQCNIARVCPGHAIVRVPESNPYLPKDLLARPPAAPPKVPCKCMQTQQEAG